MSEKLKLNIGDIVARKSYNNDVLFRIDDIIKADNGEEIVKLKGLDVRLYADSPVSDLTIADSARIREYRRSFVQKNNNCLRRIFTRRAKASLNLLQAEEDKDGAFFEVPGRVLHLDGTPDYLKLCMDLYKQLGIKAKGIHIAEKDQPASVPELLREYEPDILILTGHDGIIRATDDYSDLNNYHNSRYFVEAVKTARRFEYNRDNLIVFAGACQSHYEALLSAGANYASSPKRVFIHAFDPVFIVEKITFTSISQIIPIQEVLSNTITGRDGLGGIETRGKHRRGFPKSTY